MAQQLHLLTSSPHFSSPVTSRRIIGLVLLALLPSTAWGIVLYGLPALLTIITSVIAAVAAEALFRLVIREKPRTGDLSAILTGLLLSLVIPPSTPLWMTALGSAFAIIVAKEFFGGMGANVFNPALIGRAFLLMSFPAAITTWSKPAGATVAAGTTVAAVTGASAQTAVDAVTSATPLGVLRSGKSLEALAQSLFDSGLSTGTDYASLLKTLFLGNRAGCIGEASIFLILVGAVFLLLTKVIDWRTPFSMLATAFIASWLLGIDPVFTLLSGGLVFGAVFMATDYVTSPVTAKGKWIFGAGAGLITILIRKWGGYPEGTSYGILIMNCVSPFLDRLVDRKYGWVRPGKAGSPVAPGNDGKGTAK